MGLMNTIRKNPAILIVSIGLAMAGFILMDMLTSGGPGQANQFVLGKVNGEPIDWKVFSDTENRLFSNSGTDVLGRREQLWNYFVDRMIVTELARDLGLGVGKAELQELQFGSNLSPVIQRNFADPNTRQLDREQLNQIRQAIETDQLPAELKVFWAEQEREVIKERLQAKLASMVTKGMYTPSWQAEIQHLQRNERSEVAYVRIPFEVIPDSEISLTDADLNAYLKENASRFRQKEETRAIRYVAFEVRPSSEDSASLMKGLTDLVPAFQETDNDTLFVENNFGFIDDAFLTDELFTSDEGKELFNLPVGTVYGPFVEGNQYMVVKIRDKMIVPDSVKSRHILIQAQDPAGLVQAQATIDSLKGLIESGKVSFDTLALQYGQDATRTSGGDLGFAAQGQMVKPYNDLIFFQAQPGKLYTVTTQFGVHLVEVTDRKFIENKTGIKIAALSEPILASDITQKKAYQQALELVSRYRTLSELEQAASSAKDWMIQVSPLFKANDFSLGLLGQGSSVRDLIRWAFKQKSAGDVSAEVYTIEDPQQKITTAYVVAALDRIAPSGMPKLEHVRAEVEALVRIKAKGEKIAAQLAGNKDLESIAARYNITVDTASGVNLGSTFIPGLGNEPRFVGVVTALPVGATSKPVTGNNGVYVARVLERPSDVPPANIALIRMQNRMTKANSATVRYADAIRDGAKIVDNRSEFY